MSHQCGSQKKKKRKKKSLIQRHRKCWVASYRGGRSRRVSNLSFLSNRSRIKDLGLRSSMSRDANKNYCERYIGDITHQRDDVPSDN